MVLRIHPPITHLLIVFGSELPYTNKRSCYLLMSLLCSHIESETSSLMGHNGYNCPQCGSRYCELPVECKQCGLTLVSAPHLARSYHHLFPIKPFIERAQVPGTPHCFACAKPFSEADINVRTTVDFRSFLISFKFYDNNYLFRSTSVNPVIK